METLPLTVEELIEKLDETYPRRSLDTGDFGRSERELFFEAGQRSVVEMLLDLQQAQFEEEDGDSDVPT